MKIPVSDTQAYRQFGNSVAVPVVAAVAKMMIERLLRPADFVRVDVPAPQTELPLRGAAA